MLKLHELVGTPEMVKAGRFVFSDDFINDFDAFRKEYPPPSDEEDLVFVFAGFFELAGTRWKSKLINEALLFDWIWVPYRRNRVNRFLLGFREMVGNKAMYENSEALAGAVSPALAS